MENDALPDAFRHDKNEINHLPCVFAKPLARRVAICEFARTSARAASLASKVLCTQPLARAACAEFNGLLLQKSAFVVRRIDAPTNRSKRSASTAVVVEVGAAAPALTAAQQQQIQGGGLSGLRDTLDPGAVAPNVQRLLYAGKLRFGDFSQWPWLELIKGMAAWTPRRLRR